MNRSLVAAFTHISRRAVLSRIRGVDPLLCYMLGAVTAYGLVVLYSAVDGYGPLVRAQLLRLALGRPGLGGRRSVSAHVLRSLGTLAVLGGAAAAIRRVCSRHHGQGRGALARNPRGAAVSTVGTRQACPADDDRLVFSRPPVAAVVQGHFGNACAYCVARGMYFDAAGPGHGHPGAGGWAGGCSVDGNPLALGRIGGARRGCPCAGDVVTV